MKLQFKIDETTGRMAYGAHHLNIYVGNNVAEADRYHSTELFVEAPPWLICECVFDRTRARDSVSLNVCWQKTAERLETRLKWAVFASGIRSKMTKLIAIAKQSTWIFIEKEKNTTTQHKITHEIFLFFFFQ